MKFQVIALNVVFLIMACGTRSEQSQSAPKSLQSVYQCHAKENPNQGFDKKFDVKIGDVSVGGSVFFVEGSMEIEIGRVEQVRTIDTNPELERTLALIGEEDVSGVARADLSKVRSIMGIYVKTSEPLEFIVYRLFDGEAKQMGGTFMADGLGTACLPVK